MLYCDIILLSKFFDMAKNKKSSGANPAVDLLVWAFRFSFAWAERFVIKFFQAIKFLFRNVPVWNTQFDNWTQVQFNQTVHTAIKIAVITIILLIFWLPISIIFLGYLILKSF